MTACKIFALCSIIMFLHFVDISSGKLRLRYAHYDPLFVARCEARCWFNDNKSSCVKTCLAKGASKPGYCPGENSSLSPFVTVCWNTCTMDTQCPSLTKCCQHACGVTCQPPQHLQSAVGVPEIPTDLKLTELRRKRSIYIEWSPGESSYLDEGGGRPTLYVIEERHHTGKYFVQKRLTDWAPCAATETVSQILKNVVKPGRWYQFRVAAVNENGTKGYSEDSFPFRMSISPKPPEAPQNVTVGPLWTTNGSIYAEVRWSPPHSDLPLQKYKVFWSRRLLGAEVLHSVLVTQQVVSRDQHQFLLQKLVPNSLYFIQVQALVQFGRERLKGDKSGLVLNTTNYTNVTDDLMTIDPNVKSRIEGLHLQKLFWAQGDLRARIMWNPKRGIVRYTVTWWTGPCHSNGNGYNHLKLAATTRAAHFDLYDLQFNCRYKVSVREVSFEGMKYLQDTSVTFTTPKCDDFKTSHNKKIKCLNENKL